MAAITTALDNMDVALNAVADMTLAVRLICISVAVLKGLVNVRTVVPMQTTQVQASLAQVTPVEATAAEDSIASNEASSDKV